MAPAVDALFLAFGLGLVAGALGVRGRGTRAFLLASVALSAALAAALPLLHGSVAGAAVVLACWGASAGAADAVTRRVIADPVLDETAGFLGVGLSGLVGGAVLGMAGPDALPQFVAGLAVVVVITAAVGLTSCSRREGHRGPGALSTGSQDARCAAGAGSAVGIDRRPACGGSRPSEFAVAPSSRWFRQSRVQVCCHSTSCYRFPASMAGAAARGNPRRGEDTFVTREGKGWR